MKIIGYLVTAMFLTGIKMNIFAVENFFQNEQEYDLRFYDKNTAIRIGIRHGYALDKEEIRTLIIDKPNRHEIDGFFPKNMPIDLKDKIKKTAEKELKSINFSSEDGSIFFKHVTIPLKRNGITEKIFVFTGTFHNKKLSKIRLNLRSTLEKNYSSLDDIEIQEDGEIEENGEIEIETGDRSYSQESILYNQTPSNKRNEYGNLPYRHDSHENIYPLFQNDKSSLIKVNKNSNLAQKEFELLPTTSYLISSRELCLQSKRFAHNTYCQSMDLILRNASYSHEIHSEQSDKKTTSKDSNYYRDNNINSGHISSANASGRIAGAGYMGSAHISGVNRDDHQSNDHEEMTDNYDSLKDKERKHIETIKSQLSADQLREIGKCYNTMCQAFTEADRIYFNAIREEGNNKKDIELAKIQNDANITIAKIHNDANITLAKMEKTAEEEQAKEEKIKKTRDLHDFRAKLSNWE